MNTVSALAVVGGVSVRHDRHEEEATIAFSMPVSRVTDRIAREKACHRITRQPIQSEHLQQHRQTTHIYFEVYIHTYIGYEHVHKIVQAAPDALAATIKIQCCTSYWSTIVLSASGGRLLNCGTTQYQHLCRGNTIQPSSFTHDICCVPRPSGCSIAFSQPLRSTIAINHCDQPL